MSFAAFEMSADLLLAAAFRAFGSFGVAAPRVQQLLEFAYRTDGIARLTTPRCKVAAGGHRVAMGGESWQMGPAVRTMRAECPEYHPEGERRPREPGASRAPGLGAALGGPFRGARKANCGSPNRRSSSHRSPDGDLRHRPHSPGADDRSAAASGTRTRGSARTGDSSRTRGALGRGTDRRPSPAQHPRAPRHQPCRRRGAARPRDGFADGRPDRGGSRCGGRARPLGGGRPGSTARRSAAAQAARRADDEWAAPVGLGHGPRLTPHRADHRHRRAGRPTGRHRPRPAAGTGTTGPGNHAIRHQLLVHTGIRPGAGSGCCGARIRAGASRRARRTGRRGRGGGREPPGAGCIACRSRRIA